MKTIIVSSDKTPSGCSTGSFRSAYPRYERVQRRTPSGRVYDTVTMTNPDGSGVVSTTELTADAGRAIHTLTRCTFNRR
jgi:hypothetical protein